MSDRTFEFEYLRLMLITYFSSTFDEAYIPKPSVRSWELVEESMTLVLRVELLLIWDSGECVSREGKYIQE
jgi:hypothetical protein